jgi:hypothetical protein
VVESDEQSGHPLSDQKEEVVAKVCDLVRADKRLTIKEVAKEQGISSDSFGLETCVSKVCPMAADSAVEGAPPLCSL